MRRGEIEGLKWSDYCDGHLHVARSIWNGEILEPKTERSRSAVPVIRQLAERLEIHRMRCGEPTDGCIFSTSNSTPLSLHNVVNRQIKPIMADFHGFHAARRGLGSNLNRLGIDDSVIQKILRHSNISTTQAYYIKSTGKDVSLAMQTLENNLQDTNGTPSADSLRTTEFVN